MNDEAVSGGASLTDVAHLGAHCALDGLVNVGVLKDDERSVAAQLHRGAQDVVGSCLEQGLAHGGRAGEGNLAQARIRHDRLRDGRCRLTGNHVDHACRNAGINHGLCEVLSSQRRELGGLDHHGATSGNGRGNLAGSHSQREVPRGDEQARAHRLAAGDHAQGALRRRQGTAVVTNGLLAEPAQVLSAVSNLTVGLCQRLAHLQGHQRSKLVLALLHQVKSTAQQVGALACGRACPLILNRAGSIQSLLRILRRSGSKGSDNLTGCRVVHVESGAIGGVYPLTINQQASWNLGQQLVNIDLVVFTHGSFLPSQMEFVCQLACRTRKKLNIRPNQGK